MNNRKRRYTLRIVALLMAAPIVVFVALLTLLYLPPVQHWAVDKVTRVASEATGMDIRVGRIRLAFPLDLALKDVTVSDSVHAHTLASIGELRTGVALWPLLRGEVQVGGIGLTDVTAHTGTLIPSTEIDGQIGRLQLRHGHVDLTSEKAWVESLMLQEADVKLTLHPDDTPQDSVSSPVGWEFLLGKAEIRQVNFQLHIPADTLTLKAGWEGVTMKEAAIDLEASAYGMNQFALTGGAVSYDGSSGQPAQGFDPRHIAVSQIEAKLDSLSYKGQEAQVIIRQLTMQERSGFKLTHTEGGIQTDSSGIRVHRLRTKATASDAQADISLPWGALKKNGKEQMSASVKGEVSLTDVAKLYPLDMAHADDSPLNFRIELQGNMKHMQLDTLYVQMDSVVSVAASGKVSHLADDERRTGEARFLAVAHDLGILMPLLVKDSASVQIPQGLSMKGALAADKSRYHARMALYDRKGWLRLNGFYDTRMEEYALNLRADSLNLHRFLPKDSLGHLTLHAQAAGKGHDPYATGTRLMANLTVDSLQYGTQLITHVGLKASLKAHRAHVELESHNPMMEMLTRVDGTLHRDSLEAQAVVEVAQTDLPPLQMMRMPLKASAGVDMKPDSFKVQVETGDFGLKLHGADGLDSIMGGINAFAHTLLTQLEEQDVDIRNATTLLPDIQLTLETGKENAIADYLRHTTGISMNRAHVAVATSSATGLTANGVISGLCTDSLEFDTVRLGIATTHQWPMADKAAAPDSLAPTSLIAKLTVSNAPNPKKPAFTASLDGILNNKEGTAALHFYNDKDVLGLELGARATREEEGIRLTFFPEHPTIGFREFALNDSNYIALSDSGRITADVRLLDKAGTGLRLYSSPNEEARQDLTADLTRLNIGEILDVLPYAPDIAGMLNAELHYVNTNDNNTFSGTVQMEELSYGGYPMGDVGVEAVYLPTSLKEHLVNLQLVRNDEMIGTIDGTLTNADSEGDADRLSADISLERVPLEMANAFVPRDMVTLNGWLGGELAVEGALSAPRINGAVHFDSVRVHSPLYAVNLRVDKTPVNISDNQLIFDEFNIYAKGKNPFTLTGKVDLGDFSRMTADLQMRAVEYELLNAKKNKSAVLHGKVFVSLFSTIRGELGNPVVRGTMNVLGNTDVTYILKESPLTVEDRLGSMVTFVNFNDTLAPPAPKEEVTLGGIDMLLNVQIDQGAQVQVDLGSDNYVEVQGGGNLALQYTPQGDLLLTGRYTLDSGEMKYSLPIIPLKTFKIANGSYVEFTGDPANPYLNITATERVRTSVTEENSSRYVNFDVGVSITNSLDNMGLAFTLNAPEDGGLQNQLAAMTAEERGKLAVTMLVTGMYAGGQGGNSGGFNTGNALNSFLQSEISNIAGSALKTVDVSIGVEDNYAADGTTQGSTDYSFRFAKRFWNNRLSVIIGGRISTGNEAVAEEEGNSFIDDISLEWRLDDSGTRYVKLFHTKNYESILEGEITETGVGLVLRRKVNRLGELFIFRRKE